MEQLLFVMGGAVVVEAIVNLLKEVKNQPTLILSITIGIATAVLFNLEAFKILGFQVTVPYADYIFTGFVISRGSNVAHEIFKKLRGVQEK